MKFRHLFLFCLLLTPFHLNALPSSPMSFDEQWNELKTQKEILQTQLTPSAKRYIHNKSDRYALRLSQSNRKIANHYLKWEKEWNVLNPVNDLRQTLISQYLDIYPHETRVEALTTEATSIALALFSKTKELKKSFRMSAIPVWHNMLYDIRLKPRGECYHWANDLLEHLKPLSRNFFSVTWAQSKPGTLSEHNVTMVFPSGSDFTKGLLFDPWRTGGQAFWRSPLSEKHFSWKRWEEYGIY